MDACITCTRDSGVVGLWQASREYPKTVKFMTKLTVLTDEILTKLFPYCETERHFDETLRTPECLTVRSEKSVTRYA